MPTGLPPHKTIEAADDPGADVRLELTRAAAEGNSLLEVEPFEIEQAEADRDRPTYTLDTLKHLGGRPVLLLGADAAAGLATWHQPREVLQLADVAIAARPGTDITPIAGLIDDLGGKAPRVVEMPQIDISSTWIRQRAVSGASLRYLVPEPVREIIEARGLYR